MTDEQPSEGFAPEIPLRIRYVKADYTVAEVTDTNLLEGLGATNLLLRSHRSCASVGLELTAPTYELAYNLLHYLICRLADYHGYEEETYGYQDAYGR